MARHLAHELRLPLVDLDAEIESEMGTSVARFFESHGEAAFREVETRMLRKVSAHPAIISLGGGTPTQSANRELLKDLASDGSLVVYLEADSLTLARRIRRQPGKRPLIDGSGLLDHAATEQRVAQLLTERGPFYYECANLVVATSGKSIEAIADEVAQAWHGRISDGRSGSGKVAGVKIREGETP